MLCSYGKRVLATHSPAVATTAAYVLGSLMLLPMAAITASFFPSPDLASPVAWGVVLYQAILGAIAHVWWYAAGGASTRSARAGRRSS